MMFLYSGGRGLITPPSGYRRSPLNLQGNGRRSPLGLSVGSLAQLKQPNGDGDREKKTLIHRLGGNPFVTAKLEGSRGAAPLS